MPLDDSSPGAIPHPVQEKQPGRGRPRISSPLRSSLTLPLRLPFLRRYLKFLVAVFLLLALSYVSWLWRVDDLPPTYEAWRTKEKKLPQHNAWLPFPQGREGKYLYMANHVIRAHILRFYFSALVLYD